MLTELDVKEINYISTICHIVKIYDDLATSNVDEVYIKKSPDIILVERFKSMGIDSSSIIGLCIELKEQFLFKLNSNSINKVLDHVANYLNSNIDYSKLPIGSTYIQDKEKYEEIERSFYKEEEKPLSFSRHRS